MNIFFLSYYMTKATNKNVRFRGLQVKYFYIRFKLSVTIQSNKVSNNAEWTLALRVA